jgi:hypothetical protein
MRMYNPHAMRTQVLFIVDSIHVLSRSSKRVVQERAAGDCLPASACRAVFSALCLLLSAFCSFAWAQPPAREKAEPWGNLRVEITDRDTGKGVNARCYLTDPAGQFWSPAGAINYVKPPERHFIASGEFQIALPPRKYTLRVERGPEYRAVIREVEIGSGERREEKIELARWINMNARGWYSGDLHNHRDWREMPTLLLAEDLNLAPTLTQWVWEDRLISQAPVAAAKAGAVRSVDATHAYSVFDTEIERLRDGPGAVDLLGLRSPIAFNGYLVHPPSSVFTQEAHRQGGYVDAEKITWRDVAALVALGEVDFAGLVYNHFNRHGVETETDPWGMIPKERPEFATPAGMPLWAMEVYYRFLNCGFKLAVSAGSASGVKPSPLGYSRVYVHLPGKFSYADWLRALKAGRSFATNGPMLFLTVNGHEPGGTIQMPRKGGGGAGRLSIHLDASSRGELARAEVVWKGKVIGTVAPTSDPAHLTGDFDIEATETGWLAARAFEKPDGAVRFAHTSPVYVQVGQEPGTVAEDAKFFLTWIDRESRFYESMAGFRSDADRQAMLSLFRQARRVYERLAMPPGQSTRGVAK